MPSRMRCGNLETAPPLTHLVLIGSAETAAHPAGVLAQPAGPGSFPVPAGDRGAERGGTDFAGVARIAAGLCGARRIDGRGSATT